VNAKFRPEHLDTRHNLRDLDVDGRIILICFLQKYAVTRTGFIWLRMESSNEPPGPIKEENKATISLLTGALVHGLS
jgi:hypothetical protein